MSKPILLISYTFPPYPGIGGRRWAKFAKYLAKSGYTVHVICAKNPHKSTSFFTSDTVNENIKVHTFESGFPKVLHDYKPSGIFEKSLYKLWMKLLQWFVKGYIFDKAIFDKKKIISLANNIISSYNVGNVVVTGAPFRISYFALSLKNRFPHINLIQDFRDPWTWGVQYSKLNTEQMNFEQEMLDNVIKESDIITVPVLPMQNYLIENYKLAATKIRLLPHAFDEEEVKIKNTYRKGSFKCAFFGTMYSDIEKYYDQLCKVISNNSGKFTLDLFTDIVRYENIVIRNHSQKWIRYKKTIGAKALFETLSHYDFIVFIYPDYVKDYLSTKFYEVIHSKIPIIYIAEQGLASDYISSNKLGVHFNEKNLTDGLQNLIDGETELDYNFGFSVDEFSYSEMSKKLSAFFK